MKFAKELEHELVPEWRAKYLDYKAGKKKLKAITRALQRANRSPRTPTLRRVTPHTDDHLNTPSRIPQSSTFPRLDKRTTHHGSTPTVSGANASSIPRSTPIPRNERQPLRTPGSRFSGNVGSYGSIIATPPPNSQNAHGSDVASLKLPDPAIDPREEDYFSTSERLDPRDGLKTPSPVIPRHDTFHITRANRASQSPSVGNPSPGSGGSFYGSRGNTLPKSMSRRLFQRVFSTTALDSPGRGVQLEQFSEFELRQDEFFMFLDNELAKIETFYRMKEKEATERLQTLRQQLHIMRDRRIEQVLAAKKPPKHNGEEREPNNGFKAFNGSILKDTLTGKNRFGKNSKALAQMATSAAFQPRDPQSVADQRDFMRRPSDPQNTEVSYRSAKRKLKYALQEFYRGLELLKSYAYLNRTAFRKINKKYDKVANARPPMRYMSEKVNKAWFVQSEVVETLIVAVEDLYARYFERGNRKIAVSKLRRTIKKSGDYSPNTFRCGLLVTAGVLFAIHALVDATRHLHHSSPTTQLRTSYLLQLYGGYFLIVFHFLLFTLDCMIWTKTKINYVFVFEFDSRHALDWRQLSEIPCLFLFMLGLFMWLNFSWVNDMYIYWPVVLIGLSVLILFFPARVLYHRSRKWWAYSNWRLLLAGLYPVEFRDFFLGDMYCSQTYAMGNIELFFCLYARHWSGVDQCNSSHSRLLGFFTTVPSIWRALQCLRRYADTRNAFPHLLNFGKYVFGVMYYATLSMYRIEKTTRFMVPFITLALMNAIYTSIWDLAMDWSLCNPYARHPLLRDVLAFRNAWVYYAAMVTDVVVRNNWIFYAIFSRDMQHSALLSFLVSFSEICRRGIWTIFRVENEHCTNVLLFRASRDVPLPYEIAPSRLQAAGTEHGQASQDVPLQDQQTATPFLASDDLEHGTPSAASTHPRAPRQSIVGGIHRAGSIIASAHAQDFERRNKKDLLSGAAVRPGTANSPDDSSEEEDTGNSENYTDEPIEEEHADEEYRDRED